LTKILVVDDDPLVAKLVVDTLTADGHLVDSAASTNAARAHLNVVPYDLIVLDWNLPDGNGPELCREVRSRGQSMPVLFLTLRSSLQDKKVGYGAGADDYLSKPFEPDELRMKVKAILRRPKEIQPSEIKMRNIVLRVDTHQVFKNGVEVHLLPKEYSLLEFFMKHPNQIFKAEALLDRVWASDKTVGPDTVRVTLMRIRQKVESDFEEPMITTIRNFGYRLDP